jgi:hypothetical protein
MGHLEVSFRALDFGARNLLFSWAAENRSLAALGMTMFGIAVMQEKADPSTPPPEAAALGMTKPRLSESREGASNQSERSTNWQK